MDSITLQDGDFTKVFAVAIGVLAISILFLKCSSAGQDDKKSFSEAPPDSFYVDIDGHKIRFQDTGPPVSNGNGTLPAMTLIFVHGFAGCLETWDLVIPYLTELSKGRYRMVSMDLVGNGFSDKPSEEFEYTFRNQGQMVAQVVQEMGLEGDILLVGHSAGAIVATTAASLLMQQSTSKQIIRGLVLLAPGFLNQKPAFFSYRWIRPLIRKMSRLMAGQLASTFQALHSKPVPDHIFKSFVAARTAEHFDLAIEKTLLAQEQPYIEVLTQEFPIGKVPIHMIWADGDKVNPYAAERYQEVFPKENSWCTYQLIPGAGHYVQHEIPSEVAVSIHDFVVYSSTACLDDPYQPMQFL